MKKFFIMAVMAICSLAANAQTPAEGSVTVTPKVGVNVTNITSDDYQSLDSKTGFTAGAEVQYMVNEKFGLSAGAMFSQQGCKVGDVTWNADYVNIPIMANSYIAPGLAIKIGVQPGFKVSNKVKTGGESFNADKIIYGKDSQGVPTVADYRVQSLDVAIPIGISYEYKGVVLDARYNWGVNNMLKADGLKGHNNVFQLTLGYRF